MAGNAGLVWALDGGSPDDLPDAEIALMGQALDDLAQEPDLYSFVDGAPIGAA